MNRYEIRCTESQTKKALELGAPISFHDTKYMEYKNPTAEQMIGWLEEHLYFIYIDRCGKSIYTYSVEIDDNNTSKTDCKAYNSRKEATLAAIDAALEYLSNNKLLK